MRAIEELGENGIKNGITRAALSIEFTGAPGMRSAKLVIIGIRVLHASQLTHEHI